MMKARTSGSAASALLAYGRIMVPGALMLLGACGSEPPPLCSDGTQGCLTSATKPARVLQARVLQARVLQGSATSSSTVHEVRIDGELVDSVHLEGTVLVGQLHGAELRGADFVGATIVQREQDGSLFDSTLTQVEADPADATGEILLYTLTAVNPSTGAVENLCQADVAGLAKAIPVGGSWSSTGAHTPSATTFTFGCTRGVIAKCVRFGYKPWKVIGGRSMVEYHQACTRMARADYCGDGVSRTEDGTEIDLYDDLGINQRSPLNLLSPMLFEAAWSPQGAYCISKSRWLKLTALPSFATSCLSRFTVALGVTSPVDSRDACLTVRSEIPASTVHIDNQSGVNVLLQ